MAVNEQIVTGRAYRTLIDVASKLWQKISFWTKASDVEFNDGSTAETKVGAIKGITTDTNVTETGYAADMTALTELKTQLYSDIRRIGKVSSRIDANSEVSAFRIGMLIFISGKIHRSYTANTKVQITCNIDINSLLLDGESYSSTGTLQGVILNNTSTSIIASPSVIMDIQLISTKQIEIICIASASGIYTHDFCKILFISDTE